MDWNGHAWTMMISLFSSVGVVDTVVWACILCGHHIQNDWASRAMNLHHIFHEAWTFLHVGTIRMNQKAAAMDTWWLAASSQQHACSCITSCAEFFGEISNHLGDSAPPQPIIVTLRPLAFPKTKISFEREEISDHWWDSGEYDGAADGDWENCVRSQGTYFEGVSLSHVQCFLYLVSSLINVSIFHIIWMGTFWTELLYILIL